jgi:L-ascorbate metabolism protein UlaG (beta-lactamase superfamily)
MVKIKHSLSDHFDGKKFHNQYPPKRERSFREILQWLSQRNPPKWPKRVHTKVHQLPSEPIHKGHVRITFINHSTVLIQTHHLNILTDPIWSERCSPFKWMGPKRVAPPGIKFEDLPPIHLVLLSHNHYDHFDIPTLRRLHRHHRPSVLVALGNGKLLKRTGIKEYAEMDWWQAHSMPHAKVTFVPAQHFSRRGLFDENMTLWGGFVIEGDFAPIYFAGDTGYGTHFHLIRKKFGPIGVAMLPIGAYIPRWLMSPVHMSPEDAVKAHLDLKASKSLGIHFGTFPLGDEPFEAPVNELERHKISAGLEPSDFVALQNGEGFGFK